METIEVQEGLTIPVIIGLVAILRQQQAPAWVLPISSLIIGCAIVLTVFPADSSQVSILKGIVYGLMASGLWSSGKAIAGK